MRKRKLIKCFNLKIPTLEVMKSVGGTEGKGNYYCMLLGVTPTKAIPSSTVLTKLPPIRFRIITSTKKKKKS